LRYLEPGFPRPAMTAMDILERTKRESKTFLSKKII
jgi:hypothetical protein